jgi:hypothetical protein
MIEPLRVEAPDASLALALVERLRSFHTEVEEEGDAYAVRVTLTTPVERTMTEALAGVDRWLRECGLRETRVHLDGRMYRLTPPPS